MTLCDIIEIVGTRYTYLSFKGCVRVSRSLSLEERVSKMKEILGHSLFKVPELFKTIEKHEDGRRLISLTRMIDEGRLNMSPSYQREFVWSLEQQKAFMEAFFEGQVELQLSLIDLGNDGKCEQAFEMLDGRQRLTTLKRFVENKFAIYEGVYFENLCADDKQDVRRWMVDLVVYSKRGYSSFLENEKIELFLRLNDLGTRVSPEHLASLRERV